MIKKLDKSLIKSLLEPRNPLAHKGDHGHALIVAGNTGRMGAAVIAARACLRSGSGLLTVSVPIDERAILQTAAPEAMLIARGSEIKAGVYSAIGIGPGMGMDKIQSRCLKTIIEKATVPLVLDADAITLLAINKKLMTQLPIGTIITPHPKEFDRLFGAHETEASRVKKAIQMSEKYKIIIVLKGHETLISSPGKTYKNITGNSGLAKGGSGDALTGIITGFLAQGYSPFTSALLGVYLHGLAADITLKKQSAESMLITDVIESLGDAFKMAFR